MQAFFYLYLLVGVGMGEIISPLLDKTLAFFLDRDLQGEYC